MDEIVERIEQLELRVDVLEGKINGSNSETPVRITTKQKSLREFLNEKAPSTANSQALCIAYFFEVYKGMMAFNTDDIKAGFKEAKIPAPKNPNDIVNKNIVKSLMMDAGELKDGKKAWTLTATGEELIKRGFSKGN